MNHPSKQSNTRLIWAITAFIISVWIGSASFAQTVEGEEAVISSDVPSTKEAVNDAVIGDLLGVDYATWDRTALRVEKVLLSDSTSSFRLERSRTEVSDWRDEFSSAMSENDARLETVNAQIEALGTVPAEDETESETVTTRRETLITMRDDLAAPGLLAAEAYARADGIITEIEVKLRAKQTAALMERSVSPLNPTLWPDAVTQVVSGITTMAAEIKAGITSRDWTSYNQLRMLWAAVAVLVAIYLFIRSPMLVHNLMPHPKTKAGSVIAESIGAVLEGVLPLLGLIALAYGLHGLDVFGVRGEAVLEQVPRAGFIIIVASWLSKQFFPEGDRYGPLNHVKAIRDQLRRNGVILAWVVALRLPFAAFLESGTDETDNASVLFFPFIIVVSVALFRFATLLRHAPDENAGPDVSAGRTRSFIGRVVQLVAIAAPILAALGYDAAARAIVFPTSLSLGLIGVIIYLQTLSFRIYDLLYDVEDGRKKALAPMMVGFALFVLATPLFALIWGAQVTDLLSAWARFTAGYTWGQTKISPSDFLTFVAIFSLGYLLTGFIKTSLRSSVLPRTSLDLGAQDAIVAGFGYVGIFLAAVIAITSAGIDLSSLAIVAGALSVGIGFGLQTIVSNFVSGIILLIERPVSQGDWIEVGDQMGYVRDISVRATRIETFDRTDVIVPNADLISNQVINWTRGNLAGRLILKIGVAYGTDVDRVAGILREIAEAHPMVVMTPPPSIYFMNFGADALEFEIRAILRDVNFILSAQSELNFQISRRFSEENIEIPFAQRDIWLRNPEVLRHSETDNDDETRPAAPEFQQVRRPDDISDPDGGDTT